MIIELFGAGFQNKGAEMMLRVATAKIPRLFNQKVAIVTDPVIGSYEERAQLKLFQVFPLRGWQSKKYFKFLLKIQEISSLLFPLRLLKRYGLIPLNKIDALIDISGFAYSDQWGEVLSHNFLALAKYYKGNNKPVIMFPQAFGPFENREVKNIFTKALQYVDLVFARDKQSYEYVKQIIDKPEKLYLSPDITLFSDKVFHLKEIRSENKKYVCLVPNARMLDKGEDQWKEKYIEVLQRVSKIIISNNVELKIIIHAQGDENLVDNVKEKLTDNEKQLVQTISESDALKLKQIIGGASFIIGSRYHSLIAAFSHGVPSICMGWSHKYEQLYKDFGVENYVIRAKDSHVVEERVKSLLNEKEAQKINNKINNTLKNLEQKDEEMWKMVKEVLLMKHKK